MIVRGLGSMGINVEPLAQAIWSGQIKPTFSSNITFNAGYSSTPQLLPAWMYMDSVSAGQIAGLLGGTLVSGPPTSDVQTNTGVPNANLVQLPNGAIIVPGNLMPPGVILSYPSLCALENALVSMIPGGTVGDGCVQSSIAGSTPATPQSPGSGLVATGDYPSQPNYGTPNQQTNTTNTNSNTTDSTGVNQQTSGSAVDTTNTTNVTQGNLLFGSLNWLEGSAVGGFPNWALVAGAALALLLLKK